MTAIHVIFDFDAKKAILSGITETPIEKSIDELSLYEDNWNTEYFLEHPMGENGEKWVFSWKQWANKEQFFELKQYYPFPKTTAFIQAPIQYDPWTSLARWSYIANPSPGTIQTNKVYRIVYRSKGFPGKKISFEVNGKPSVGNWNTTNAEKGYWY